MICATRPQRRRRSCRYYSSIAAAMYLIDDRANGCTCPPDEVDYETAHEGDQVLVWLDHLDGCPCVS